jgi:hypothetical protein
LVTNPHDPEHPSTSSAAEETTEVPLLVEPVPPRRWSKGHTIAAAVVAVGALVAGGTAVAVHYSDSTSTAASGQPQVRQNRSQQQPLPGQGPLGSLGQLDVGQLDGLLNQLSNGKLDSDQLRALLALFGLPDHLDAGQLQHLLQQLGGGHLLDGAGADGSSGLQT